MARLIWTEPALRDLETIAEYIALDKPGAAQRFVQKVFRAAERLAQFPKSGRVPPELPDFPYREIIVRPCRVFYRIERQTVFIIYIMRSEQELREESLEGRKE
jgi:toxin ParE1/3/4